MTGNYNGTMKKIVSPASIPAWTIISAFFLAGIILIFFADGTADEGDSIMHYLYARHAFEYPEHFLNQWAKPVYVLLTAPAAQLGFTAIKFFNLLCSVVALWLTFKTAKRIGLSNAWIAPLLAACSPMLIIVTLSGLTEPLFSAWMMAGLYLLITGKKISGTLWLSFLPFIRSEGLIVLCVILLYLLVTRSFRYIPLLLTGHLIYSIAGYSFYKDPLWVFNKLTYATLNSVYGKGSWTDFIIGMPEITGIPVYILLLAGLLYGFYLFIRKYFSGNKETISNDELYLVYGCFTANFIGHAAFWALGIFNSFGLLRVMVGVLPLAALIGLRGLNFITHIFASGIIKYLLIAAVIIFPFAGTRYSFHWKRDFTLKADQKAEWVMANFVKKNYPDYRNYTFYYEACWISVALDINHFDSLQHKRLLDAFSINSFPEKCFLVWDDWFARVEGRVELQHLLDDPRFELLQSFEEKDYWGVTRSVKLFRKK
jgi:hypothetical protein